LKGYIHVNKYSNHLSYHGARHTCNSVDKLTFFRGEHSLQKLIICQLIIEMNYILNVAYFAGLTHRLFESNILWRSVNNWPTMVAGALVYGGTCH